MKKIQKNRAFTLIELLTVMAIFAVISATVMVNYKDFGQKTKLKNLSYNIALAISEAQVSGLSGRNIEVSGGDYYSSYGVFFNFATPARVVFFKDDPQLGTRYKFDGATEEVPEASFDILGGFKVGELCVYSSINSNCAPSAELHISFKRPHPDAYIYNESGGPYPRASIEILSRSGDKLYVSVESAGQISVQKNP